MKKLPGIYKNPRVVSTNKDVFYSFEKDENNDRTFNKEDVIFNDVVIIKTIDNNTYVTKIVAKLKDHILTSNKDIIYFKDIRSIKRKDH